MIYMTKSQFDSKLAKARRRNETIEYKRRLREERMKHWPKFVMPSTSKIVLIVAAILCVEILFFCQWMIVRTGDTNALYAMVGVITALSSIVIGYFVKSTKQNTVGGITYETAMAQLGKPTITNEEIPTDAVG